MKIKYFAWLKNFTKIDEEIIVDSSVKDIETLKKILIKKYPDLEKFFNEKNMIRFAKNLEYTCKNEIIEAEDEIALFPPVSGG